MNKWARVLFSFLLLLPVTSAFAAIAHRVDSNAFRVLDEQRAKGARVQLSVDLGEQPVTLELERFEVFHPDAEIRIYGDNDTVLERLAPPSQQYFRGYLGHDPDSLVFLVAANGRYEGLVLTENRRYEIVTARQTRVGTNARGAAGADVFVMESPLDEDFSGTEGFTCDVDKAGIAMGRFGSLMKGLKQRSEGALSSSPNTLYALNVAIETDYELFLNAGSSSSNVTTFIANLVGATSTIYKRDISTEVILSHLGIHTTSSDPFTANPGTSGTWNGGAVTYSTFHALLELGDRWHAGTPGFTGPRSVAVLVSGKSQLAGIAWIQTLCQADFLCQNGNCGDAAANGHYGGGYSYCGGIDPPGDNAVPNPDANAGYTVPSSNYWPLLQFAHEIGHNVGSGHTHCYDTDAVTAGLQPIDSCVSCSTGAMGSVPVQKGTIMSYCHLFGGSQSRFVFGPAGEPSAPISALLRNSMQTYTPTLSLITAPSSVNSGVASNASVTAAGGISYSWTITNGTINGSSTSASVSFTGTTSPVTLKVKATNAGGCSVTDFVTITVNTASCSYSIAPTSRSHGRSATSGQTIAVTAGVGCAWTAVSNSQFISITGGSNGSGNGTVTYSLTANSTGSARVGTITVAGHTFTINQSAVGASAHTDFNGDGYADLLFRSSSSGANVPWLMNGASVSSSVATGPLATNWSVAGIGDFDGDGRADIFWRSPSTSEGAVWFMNGSSVVGGAYIPSASSQWVVQGVGDFSGDGKADILWRNSSTYEAVVWVMNGASIVSSATIAVPGPQWTINGVGDFNGDTRADILWRNTNTSEAVVWLMNGAAILSANYVASPNSIWSVRGVGDFNGDGMTDIFWVNTSNQTVVWLMNGLNILASGYSATPPLGWQTQGVGDYDGDGKADLMWRNTSSGQNALWFMNGINVASGVYITSLADTSFNVVGPK